MERERGDSLINYNELLKGLYGNQLENVSRINKNYEIYEGKQQWPLNENLDYEPTQQITNFIKKLIDTKARFMFGREPFFDIRQIATDAEGSTKYRDEAQEKEDLLKEILDDNLFHSRLMKAKKDCSIGGRIAIKLWGHSEKGVKIIFSPAQEFFTQYNIDDIDELEKVTFLYALNNEDNKDNQRIKKQEWEMVGNVCILNEGIYDGNGDLIEEIETDRNTQLDFIPVIIIQNGGLTGDTDGTSDVELLWQSQDAYNKLQSDDLDALKFNMFPQKVATDADENSLKNLTIAPGALIDLQTDMAQGSQGRQANMQNLESSFSYGEKFETTLNRHKNNMYELMEVPNTALDQLKGLMTSGKSMKALYWGLISASEEEWTEWDPKLSKMADYIFQMVDIYNCYGARQIAKYETGMEIIKEYPLQDDMDEQKQIDMEEVITEVRSRESYINKWSNVEDIEAEMEQIRTEKDTMSQDNYSAELMAALAGDDEDEEEAGE